jgi:hypothetical protein
MKTISKIEIATQNSNGITTTGLSVHGPGKDWGNLVAHELQEANVPSGDLVHLCLYRTDGSCTYQFFNW